MASTVTRLRTKADRLRADEATQLRQLLLGFEGIPERARGEIIAAIDRSTQSDSGWTFVMISPSQHAAVVAHLLDHSAAPKVAVRVWAICFTALRNDTGEIMLTREELAEQAGSQVTTISRIMTELEDVGAIIRRRERVAGLKGPGLVRYFMNPRVGTHATGAARDRAQAKAPALAIVGGGKG